MSVEPRRYEVVSVSLPSDLVKRANALLPKTRRSRVIATVLASFLDAIERSKVSEEYRAYYAQRPAPEAKEERDLLAEWQVSDREALASKAITEQIRAVDKRRLVRRLGRLAPDLLARVERALKNTLAFP